MGGSARERQVAHGGAKRTPAASNLDARAGRRVLSADEPERDGVPERRRPRGAGDAADGGAIGPYLGARLRHLGALEQQSPQVTIDVTAVADAHHDFLPRIAALRLRDKSLERDLRQQHAWIDVPPEPRRARLDAERLERALSDRPRTRGDDSVPDTRRRVGGRHDPHLRLPRLGGPTDETDV